MANVKHPTPQDVKQILDSPIFVVDEDYEYVISKSNAARVIAGFVGYSERELYELPDMQLLATTFGCYLNKTDPLFREEIIEELIAYQTESPSLDFLAVPAIETSTYEKLVDGDISIDECTNL